MPDEENHPDEQDQQPDDDQQQQDQDESQEDTDQDQQQDDWRENFDASKAAERIHKVQNENKNLRDRAKTAESKAASVDDLTRKNADLATQNLRLQVGYELGLPMALTERLRGATREEIVQDAQALVEIAGASKPTTSRRPVENLRGGGNPTQEPEELDLDKIAARMARR